MAKSKKRYPSFRQINLAGKVALVGEELKLRLNSPQLLQHFLKSFAKEKDDFSMNIKLKRPLRTESQNSYLHVYLDLISLSSGHSAEDLKDWIHQDTRVLGKGITEVFGTKVRNVMHTSQLNISEFCEMMNRIEEVTGIPLPDPEPFNLPMSFDEYHKLVLEEKEVYKKMQCRI